MKEIRDKVREIAEEVDQNYRSEGEQKAASCGPLSNRLAQKLEEEEISCEVIEGSIRGGYMGDEKTRHLYVVVDEGEEELIVDLSLCQFTEDNAIEHGWDVFIPEDDIPEIVITSKGEKFYDYYVRF